MSKPRFTKNIRLASQTYELLLKHKDLSGQPMNAIVHRAILAYIATSKDEAFDNRLLRLESKLMHLDLSLNRLRNWFDILSTKGDHK